MNRPVYVDSTRTLQRRDNANRDIILLVQYKTIIAGLYFENYRKNTSILRGHNAGLLSGAVGSTYI
jgi:hypothetical protein